MVEGDGLPVVRCAIFGSEYPRREGIKRDIRWHGKVVGSYQDFSDSTKAGLALLRARRPEVFAEGWRRKARAAKPGAPTPSLDHVHVVVRDATALQPGNADLDRQCQSS